jgi:MATE family multidrug resistance protein
LKISKERSILVIRLGAPSAMQMFFLVGLFTEQFDFRVSGIINQAANQIALFSHFYVYMFAMGLSVAASIRVGIKGLGDYKQLRIVAFLYFIGNNSRDFFALIFVLFPPCKSSLLLI